MADLLKKLFFDDVRKNNWPETGIVFIVFFDPLSQSIGRGRISREGALDARESRERRDKIAPKSCHPSSRSGNFTNERAGCHSLCEKKNLVFFLPSTGSAGRPALPESVGES